MRYLIQALSLTIVCPVILAGTSEDANRWQPAWGASWVDARLLHEGYEPLIHGAKRYYCRVDAPGVGSRLNSNLFCEDADTLEASYNARGGHPPP